MGVHVSKRSALFGFATAATITLGATGTVLPASAASATSSGSSASSVSPADVGKILCDGDLCIQRITSIVNGTASVKAWADTTNFTGFFIVTGNGYFQQSPTRAWKAGGAGFVFTGVPQGGGLQATSFNTVTQVETGKVLFGV